MTSLIGNSGLRGATGSGLGNKTPSGYKSGRMQNFTPEQMQLFQQMFSNVSPDSYLSKLAGGDQGLFNQMEAPAVRDFNTQIGQLGSRFSGMGMGAQKSSGFQNTVTSAASQFSQDLQSRRQQMQQQAIMDLMGLSEHLLQQRPYDNFMIKKQKKPSFLQNLFGGGSALAGAGAGAYFGGMQGAQLGGQIGGSFGQAFM